MELSERRSSFRVRISHAAEGWGMENSMWEFPKIRGTFLGVPIIGIIVFWGLYCGFPIYGNYHVACKFFGCRGLRLGCLILGRSVGPSSSGCYHTWDFARANLLVRMRHRKEAQPPPPK